MESLKSKLSKKKRLVLKITCILLIFLVICTFISRTIYTMLLPNVETEKLSMSNLNMNVIAKGKIDYTDKEELKAVGNIKITDVFISGEKNIKKGDPLFAVDTKDTSLQEKKLELSILQLQQQLKPNEITPAQKSETQLQLKIAQMEYDLFKINAELEAAIADEKHKVTLVQLREQSKETQAQLQLAIDELNKYRTSTTVKDRSEEFKIKKVIEDIQSKLKENTITEDERKLLETELRKQQLNLEAVLAAYPQYDAITEQRLRLAVMQASNKVLLLDLNNVTTDEKNSVQLQYEIAQKEYEQYLKQNNMKNDISAEKLQLDILRFENMLNPTALSNAQKAQINLSIDIAKQELNDFKANFPSDGVVKAKNDFQILQIEVEKGDTVQDGEVLLVTVPNDVKPCIRWETSNDVGYSLNDKTVINASYKMETINAFKQAELKTVNQTIKVNTKKSDETNNKCSITSILDNVEGDVKFGSTVDISITNISEMYQSIVPLSSIHEGMNNKKIVMVVSTRKGLFSEESIVTETEVTILEKNNLYAAVKSEHLFYGIEVVKYTSKPLRNGDVVNVQKS